MYVWPKEVREATVPAGDYYPENLKVRLGRLSIFLSNNYHSDGKPRSRAGIGPVCGVRIRKDKPFVLDFRNEPKVLFAEPAAGRHYEPGETVEVKAVLIDPVLDVMIRELEVVDRKVNVAEKTPEGREDRSEEWLALDGDVFMSDSAGKKLGRGVLAFG